MRISDWSSDVCSSDLPHPRPHAAADGGRGGAGSVDRRSRKPDRGAVMTSKSLTWNGDAISAKLKQAQIAGVNATMGSAVQHAHTNHPGMNRTGLLEGGINILDDAAPIEGGAGGSWGVNDVVSALMIETEGG